MDVGFPGVIPLLILPAVVVAVLGFLPLAFGALRDGGHGAASFRVEGYLDNPARRVPRNRR
jgi:hypothetical protein